MRFNRTIRLPLTQSDGDDFVVSEAAYTANDCVGGLAKVFYGTGGGITLIGIEIQDNHVQKEPFIVHIFKSEPETTIADAAAMALVEEDGYLEIATITVAAGQYITTNGGAYSKAFVPVALNLGQVDELSEGTFYVYLECTATPDYAAVDDLTIDFVFWLD